MRAGVFTRQARVRLTLGRSDARGRTRLDLRLNRIRIRDIRAVCGVLPATISRTGPPLELETRLRLRNGSLKGRVAVRQRWRCTRDRHGEFAGLRPVKRKSLASRPGLSVAVKAPRVLPSGRRARVRVTVRNTRSKRRGRLVSSLYDLRIVGSAGARTRAAGIHELRARRTRTVRLTVPVPRAGRCASGSSPSRSAPAPRARADAQHRYHGEADERARGSSGSERLSPGDGGITRVISRRRVDFARSLPRGSRRW